MNDERFDVIVVGGGPAGLSAALVLGRALRRVLIIDAGRPRNAAARAVHGFLSRDGTSPHELLRVAREQLQRYQSVRLDEDRVEDAVRVDDGFAVHTRGGARYRARKLIIATGLVDVLPEVEGLAALFGTSAFNCPYCDGYEHRESPLAVYGTCDGGAEFALELLCWSRDLVLCTDGKSELTAPMRATLGRNEVAVRDERIVRLEAPEGRLKAVVFASGPPLPRRAIFVHTAHREASDLAMRLGVEGASPDDCQVAKHGRTSVAGLFVVGDASRDVLQVAVAVSEGCEAGMTAHTELVREALR